MEITIRPEKYINAPAPEITEEMLDWLFHTLWSSTRLAIEVPKKIHSVTIRANQAYEGSGKVHFYVSFNNSKEEIHKEWWIGLKSSQQHPDFGNYFQGVHEPEMNWLGKPKERWEWMADFIQYGEVDMGPEGVECMNRIEEMRLEYERREKIKKEEEAKEYRYQQYLKLKEEFE